MPCVFWINSEGSDCIYFVPQFFYSYLILFIHSHLFYDGNQLSAETQTIKKTNKGRDIILSGASNV